MDIIETINIINETYKYVYETYGSSNGNFNPIQTFTGGFCYEYYIILHRFFPFAKLMMQNDKMHCAALIDGEIYDVTGLREDSSNFHEVNGCDMEYIYNRYGFLNAGFKDVFNKIVVKNVYNKGNSFTKKRNKIA